MRKIDFHVHAYPDAIARRAVKRLVAVAGLHACADGTLAGTKEVMAESGCEAFVLLNIANSPESQTNCNNFSIAANGGNIYAFGSVHPYAADALAELQRIATAGLRGVKFHSQYQNIPADAPEALPIYRRAAELGLILMFHGGYDPGFPGSDYASPQRMRRVLDHLPGAKIVVAHLGEPVAINETMELLVGQDVYLDVSMVQYVLSAAKVRRLVQAHGADKILYGSDCPWGRPQDTFTFLESLGLPEEDLAKIYHQNAERLLGLR